MRQRYLEVERTGSGTGGTGLPRVSTAGAVALMWGLVTWLVLRGSLSPSAQPHLRTLGRGVRQQRARQVDTGDPDSGGEGLPSRRGDHMGRPVSSPVLPTVFLSHGTGRFQLLHLVPEPCHLVTPAAALLAAGRLGGTYCLPLPSQGPAFQNPLGPGAGAGRRLYPDCHVQNRLRRQDARRERTDREDTHI